MEDNGQPPIDQLLNMMMGCWNTQLIYVIARLGIPDLLEDGPRGASELADATRTQADLLERVLRAGTALGLLNRDGNQYALSPLSSLLRTGVQGSVRATALLLGEEFYKAWGELLHQVQTGELAFERAVGAPIFEFYQANPEAEENLNESMAEFSVSDLAVLDDYDFRAVGTVIDVGGGQGALIATLLQRYPDLKGKLLELPAAAAKASESFVDLGLEERCEVIVGDMFESVPHSGDIYVLKRILHDWDDEQATTILRNCREAMTRNARLLIIEPIVSQEPGFDHAKLEDITMMLFGGEDRTEAHLLQLLDTAGLRKGRLLSSDQSGSQCLEALPV